MRSCVSRSTRRVCCRVVQGAIIVCMGVSVLGCARSNRAGDPSTTHGAERIGLSVESWVIRDKDFALARALADLSASPEWLDGETAALWRSNGLRVLSMPIEQLTSLRQSLPAGGPTENRELGESTSWTPIATGPDLADRVLRLDSGLLEVGPGQVRLLARSWIEPVILTEQNQGEQAAMSRVGSRVRIELAPQYAERLAARSPLQIEAERRPSAVDRGLVFDRLVLSMLVGGDMAIVLIGESPDVDWNDLAEQNDSGLDDSRDDQGQDDLEDGDAAETPPPDDRVEFPLAGPRLHPTLGEALLNASSYAAGSSPLRVVVVLVASPPADFALLNR